MKNILLIVLCMIIFTDSLVPEGTKINLKLEDSITYALKNNIDLKIQILDYKISNKDVSSNKALFIPTLLLNMEKTKTNNPSSSLLDGADISEFQSMVFDIEFKQNLPFGGNASLYFNENKNETNNSFANLNPQFNALMQFSLSQPLLKGFGSTVTRKDILISMQTNKSSFFRLKEKVLETVYNVETAYWDLVYFRLFYNVKKESLKAAKDLESINLTKLKVGAIPELEILIAKSEVANKQSEIIQAESSIRDAEENLMTIMNLHDDVEKWRNKIIPVDDPETAYSYKIPSIEEAVSIARENDPLIKRLEHELKGKGIEVKYRKNMMLPELNFNFNYWTTGISGDEIIYEGSGFERKPVNIISRNLWVSIQDSLKAIYNNWNISLNLKIPLTFKESKANFAIAKMEFQKAELNIRNAQQSALKKIHQSLREVQTNKKTLEAYKVSRKLSKAQLNAEEKKFKAGMSTNYNVLKAQENLEENRSSEIKAIINLNKSILNLQKNLGILLKEKGIHFKPESY